MINLPVRLKNIAVSECLLTFKMKRVAENNRWPVFAAENHRRWFTVSLEVSHQWRNPAENHY